MVKAFVGKVSLYRKSFIQRFRLKSDGADDAKPEARKTLRKENTETFALFKMKKSDTGRVGIENLQLDLVNTSFHPRA